MPVQITRRAHFCAAHRLHSPHFSDEENRRIYGKCNNPFGHGHNYWMDVTVEGEVDPKTGMVINLFDLKDIIEREIVEPVDHHNLNEDVEMMNGIIPTIENMVVRFWEVLSNALPQHVRLVRLHIQETDKNSVTYFGPSK